MRIQIITVAPSKAPDWLTTQSSSRIRSKFASPQFDADYRSPRRWVIGVVRGRANQGTSIAHGQLIPLYEVRSIQHLEGGTSMTFSSPRANWSTRSTADATATRWDGFGARYVACASHNLALEKMRAEALLAHRDMDTRSLHDISADLIAKHVQVHQLRLEQRTKEHDVLSARIAQKKAEIAGPRVLRFPCSTD